jgi:DNA-directed RNA polymerase specialized sigma54-like protein
MVGRAGALSRSVDDGVHNNERMVHMTNAEFSNSDKAFARACKAVELPCTRRQASKFRRQLGLAYTKGMAIVRQENKEGKGN